MPTDPDPELLAVARRAARTSRWALLVVLILVVLAVLRDLQLSSRVAEALEAERELDAGLGRIYERIRAVQEKLEQAPAPVEPGAPTPESDRDPDGR